MRGAAGLAAVLCLWPVCRAQPLDSLVTELSATEHRAADRTASLREREQASDKAIELRAKIIAGSGPDDQRLPGWLMDQGAAELARLARDGSDTATVFGIPLAQQSAAAREAAERALEALNRAAGVLATQRSAVAASGAVADDPRLTAIDQAKAVRIPFFGARADIILAACSTGMERSRHAQDAYDAIGKITLASPGPEAVRRISLGAALLMRSPEPEKADLESALAEFGWVLTGGPGGQAPAGTSGPSRAEAWFGLVLASARLGKLEPILEQFRPAMSRDPFVTEGHADALLSVLGTDAVTRAFAEQGLRNRDRSRLDKAVAEQQALLRRTDLGVRAESLRPLAFQKLHLVVQGADATLELPPAMDLAGAIDAARDPKRRDEAVKRLRAVADSPDAGDFATDALWETAVMLTQGSPSPGDRLAAGLALTRLAKEFPQSPRAAESMNAALAYLQALVHEGKPAEAQKAYIAALSVATERYPSLPNIDTWRYEFARVIVDSAGESGNLQALGALREVSPGASIAADAARLCERVQAEVLDGLWAKLAEVRRTQAKDAVRQFAREKVLPEARLAVQWAQSRKSASLDRFRADLAEALTESGESGGGAIYADLLSRKVEVPGGEARLELGRARSMILAGDASGAFSILRDLGTTLDVPAPGGAASSRPEVFWHAWTLMLEELASRNADGSRTGTIRANIRRLESIDPGLGGEPWKSRIDAVSQRLKT